MIRLLLALCLSGLTLVQAHTTPRSTLYLDLSDRRVALELYLSVRELALAAPELDAAVRSASQPASGALLRRYLQEHLALRDDASRLLPLHFGTFALDDEDLQPYLVVTAHADTDAAATGFTLHCDAIIHRVVSHKIYLMLRGDFEGGRFETAGELINIFGYQHLDVRVDRDGSPGGSGFATIFRRGMTHIAEGSDHLLFLLALLLPIPLTARGRRWQAQAKPIRRAWIEALGIVTAFTLGHTLTLALATFDVVRFPVQGVEVLVAASIFAGALHALRPMRQILLLTFAFGLIHGMAFSEALVGFHFDPLSRAIALLGFTLGIETMQLLLTSTVIVLLLCIAATPSLYRLFRLSGALVIMVAAVGWILARLFQTPLYVAETFDRLPGYAHYFFTLLLLLAMVGWGMRRFPVVTPLKRT